MQSFDLKFSKRQLIIHICIKVWQKFGNQFHVESISNFFDINERSIAP